MHAPTLADDRWSREIVPQLPSELAAQARTLKAFVRVRGLASATDLLRALLAFALDGHSARSLGAWALLIGLADLSEAAWRKRLRRAAPWLGWLLSTLLSASPLRPLPTTRRVRRIDATCVPRLGANGGGWRLHFDYDLTHGCLGSVTIAPYTTGEHLDHYPFLPGDILVSDAGYGYRRNLASVVTASADLLVRMHPRTFPLAHHDGTPLEVVAWLRAGGSAIRQWQGWCVWKGTRSRVRLVAAPLPPEHAARASKRTARTSQRTQRRVGADARYGAGWLLLRTTRAAEEWPAAEVRSVYRARWHVELVFTRFKHLVRVRSVRCTRDDVAEATRRALMIAWVLQENLGWELRRRLATLSNQPGSRWQLAQVSRASMRQAVAGSWSLAQLRACLPRLGRLLGTSPRKREQQETRVRRWLNQHCGMAEVPKPS